MTKTARSASVVGELPLPPKVSATTRWANSLQTNLDLWPHDEPFSQHRTKIGACLGCAAVVWMLAVLTSEIAGLASTHHTKSSELAPLDGTLSFPSPELLLFVQVDEQPFLDERFFSLVFTENQNELKSVDGQQQRIKVCQMPHCKVCCHAPAFMLQLIPHSHCRPSATWACATAQWR